MLQTTEIGPQRLDQARQGVIRGLVACAESATSPDNDHAGRTDARRKGVEWALIALALDRVECAS